MRERLVNISLTIAVILLAEGFLRLVDPIGIEHFEEVRKYADGLVFGESYGYIQKPHYQARLQGVDMTINRHGLRSPETAIEKPSNTKRLLILGDSVVLGWGAPQDSIFPARLQRILAADCETVEVIAAGVGSWNTRTEFEWLRARGMAFDPDVVLLLVVGNDADPKNVGHTDVPVDSLFASSIKRNRFGRFLGNAWHAAFRRSYLLGYVQYTRQLIDQRRVESRGYDAESPQWRDAQLALDGIIDLCEERRTELIIFLYGDVKITNQSGVLRAYKKHIEQRGLTSHTLPGFLFAQRRYHNSIVDGHENAEGHAILAGAMIDVVREHLSSGAAQ